MSRSGEWVLKYSKVLKTSMLAATRISKKAVRLKHEGPSIMTRQLKQDIVIAWWPMTAGEQTVAVNCMWVLLLLIVSNIWHKIQKRQTASTKPSYQEQHMTARVRYCRRVKWTLLFFASTKCSSTRLSCALLCLINIMFVIFSLIYLSVIFQSVES